MIVSADTDICNLALANLGTGMTIGSLSEKSQEARVSALFYPTALRATLRDCPWPFASTFTTLNLVEEDPNDEWAYSYRYPTDCVMFRRILSGTRNDSRQSRIPYRLGRNAGGRLIYSDFEEAQGEYTALVEDPAHYPPDFVIAFAYRLSMLTAPQLVRGDLKLIKELQDLYRIAIVAARANAFAEEQPDEPVESEFIRARE
jgi:hypothetical protein